MRDGEPGEARVGHATVTLLVGMTMRRMGTGRDVLYTYDILYVRRCNGVNWGVALKRGDGNWKLLLLCWLGIGGLVVFLFAKGRTYT